MRKLILFHPTSYQRAIINALEDGVHKYVIANLSRRIGKSLLAKNFLLKYALSNSNKYIGYITPTGDLARKFIKEICKVLKGTGAVKTSNAIDKFIEFSSGSIVYFLSSESGDSLRGNGFDLLIIDEASFISEETYTYVIKAFELNAKKVFMISTPNGCTGFFYDSYLRGLSSKDEDRKYISFKTTLEESGLYDEDTIQDIRGSVCKLVYEQEYMCEFLSSGISCFGNVPYTKKWGERTETLYAGIDFSSLGEDSSVLTILNDRYETVYQKSWINGNLKSLEEMGKILTDFKVQACYGETNSIGNISIEKIQETYPYIEGFTTTNKSKRDAVEFTMLNFEKGVGSVLDTESNRLQFGNFVRKIGKNGMVSYGNLSDSLHDDAVMSYVIASQCVKDNADSYCIS